MARHVFAPPIELAIASGLPELLDSVREALPAALAIPFADYEGGVKDAAEAWTRKLLAKVITPPVHIDASASKGAPYANIEE